MFWALLFFLIILVLLTEVSVSLSFSHTEIIQAQLMLKAAHIHSTWRFRLVQTDQGRRLFRLHRNSEKPMQPAPLRHGRSRLMAEAFLQASRAWRFLFRHIRLDQLDGFILLRTEDAAHSALLAGLLQGISSCLPSTRRQEICLRIMPEFFRSHSTVQLRCIFRVRLGTLFLTAGMLLANYLWQHPTESEAIHYGTSHR